MPLVTIASGRSIAFDAWQVVPAGLCGIWRDAEYGATARWVSIFLVALGSVAAVALGNLSGALTILVLQVLAEAIADFTLSHTALSVEAVPATI